MGNLSYSLFYVKTTTEKKRAGYPSDYIGCFHSSFLLDQTPACLDNLKKAHTLYFPNTCSVFLDDHRFSLLPLRSLGPKPQGESQQMELV